MILMQNQIQNDPRHIKPNPWLKRGGRTAAITARAREGKDGSGALGDNSATVFCDIALRRRYWRFDSGGQKQVRKIWIKQCEMIKKTNRL
jgi:hypothetical protein